MYLPIFLVAGLAFLIIIIITPYIRRLAIKLGAVDKPNPRRINTVPVPGIGGLGIVVAIWTAILVTGNLHGQTLWIMAGSLMIMTIGLLDDLFDLSPWLKLAVQIGAAVLIVVVADVKMEFIRLPFSSHYIGFANWVVPVTVFWIVGVTNALNFIDGIDGLTAGTAGIAASTLLVVALLNGQLSIALILAAIAGSSFGFLKYNFNPAVIFMGDTGALTLGYLLGILSVQGLMKSATTIAIAVPILALGLPLVDTLMAITRRILSGKSPFHADRGHIHHRLLDRGLSQKQVVSLLYELSLLSGCLALMLTQGIRLYSGALFIVLLTAIAVSVYRSDLFHRVAPSNTKDFD